MRPEQANPLGQSGIVGRDHASIAGTPKVFGWEKAETPQISNTSGIPAFIDRPYGLAGIFDNGNFILPGNLGYGVHVRTLSEQMHGEQCLDDRT